ncbi:hypothetical protein BDV18DRAFT_147531 [Aspergillus unguis]
MSTNKTNPNITGETLQGGRAKATTSLRSQQDTDTSGWSVEEMLETGLDKDGNIVSDKWSWIDGDKLSKGQHGSQEADDVAASLNEHF